MPIIEQPGDDDDFHSPEMQRFAAAGFALANAGWAALWVYVFSRDGCIPNGCTSSPDSGGLEGLGFLVWFVPQIILLLSAGRGVVFLVGEQPRHPVALRIAISGLLITALLVGVGVFSFVRTT